MNVSAILIMNKEEPIWYEMKSDVGERREHDLDLLPLFSFKVHTS